MDSTQNPSKSPVHRGVEVWNRLGPFLALFIVYLGFALYNHHIFSLGAFEKLGQQTVVIGIAALGMTLVILTAGIDLSAGSVIALTTVVIAKLLAEVELSPWVAALGGISAGVLCGAINGILITRLKLVPFIVTLGMLLIVRGVAKALSDSMQIKVGTTWLSELLAALPESQRWQLLPPGAWIMILLAVGTALFLKYTPLGRHIFAVGSNENTARLCGISVDRVKILVYSIAGGFAGLAGLMLLSYQEQGDPTGAEAYELDIIAAVVIGGGSLSGGQGSVLGTLVGAAIMTVIRFGCQLNGFPPWVTQVATGGIIIIAVALDRLRHQVHLGFARR